MKNLKEELRIKKAEIDDIEVPDELEDRLRNAIGRAEKGKNTRNKGRFTRYRAMIAAALVIVFLGAYNYDALAYYGKKIMGYDRIVEGSIKELNDMGRGQEINKTYTFKDGSQVTLSGIMLDENQLVVLYRVKADSEEKVVDFLDCEIRGAVKKYMHHSGYGQLSDDRKEAVYLQKFDAPDFYEKTLTFSTTLSDKGVHTGETGTITFSLDRNKAMMRVVKQDINQTVDMDGLKVTLKSITATQMSTVLEGHIDTSKSDSKFNFTNSGLGSGSILNIGLKETYIKDGKTETGVISSTSQSISDKGAGIDFKYEYDGLYSDIQGLFIDIQNVENMTSVDREIPVSSGSRDIEVTKITGELVIKEVRVENGKTVVVFNSPKDVEFDTALMIGGIQVNTIDKKSGSIVSGSRELTEKTYTFDGTGSDMKLMFKTLSHIVPVQKEIEVKINK
jgi:hypothetical protein